MKTYLILSLALWAILAMCRAQTNRQGPMPQNSVPAPASGSSTNSGGGGGASSGSGDQGDPDLLDTFDKYLLNNLEQVYYRLSYAFKDATKKTLDKCGCSTPTVPQSPLP